MSAKIALQAQRIQKYLLSAIVIVFIALCVFYNYATPLFEGLDEGAHYNYINYLATYRSLPDLNSRYIQAIAQTHQLPDFSKDPGALGHETTQPPLYYATGALLIAWIDRGDFSSIYKSVDSMSHGMANLHTSAELIFPPAGTALAVRIVRLLSTLLGVALIIFVYQIAIRVMHRADVALLASCITAFNPKFIHISSVITNDIAVASTFTLALYLAVVLITTTAHNTRRYMLVSFALGVSIGLSALSKYSGLSAMLPGGVGLIWYAAKFRRQMSFWHVLLAGVLTCGAGLLITSGWFFGYNWFKYGNPLAWAQVQQANAFTYRVIPLSISEMLSAVPMLFRTYWGVFGDGIQSAIEYDLPMWIITVSGTLGVLIAVLRRRIPSEVLILIVSAIAVLISFVSWMRTYAVTDNSRLLMPVTSTVSVLIAVGLLEWFHNRWRTRAVSLLSACAILWALFIPTVSLLPNYNPLTYLTESQVAQLPNDGHVIFDNGIELYSVELISNRVDTGKPVDLSIYWRATRPITESYATVLEAFSEQGQSLGRLTTDGFLGRQYVTPEWEVGRVLKMNYRLSLSAANQTLARIYVGWYTQVTGKISRVLNKDEVSVQVATVKIRGIKPEVVTPSTTITALFGDVIQLQGYTSCGDKTTLYWFSTGAPALNYTVFVHALNSQGQVVGQSDAPVAYPTLFWDKGEQILDLHPIPGQANATKLEIGLYNPETQERLTARDQNGNLLQDNVLRIDLHATPVCK